MTALVALSSVAAPAAADPPAAAPAPSGSTVSRRDVARGAAVVAGAATAGAIALGLVALHDRSVYDRAPTYAGADNGSNLAAYADGCAALAVAAAVTSLVLFVTSAPPDRAPALSAAPVVTAHGGGVGAVIRF